MISILAAALALLPARWTLALGGDVMLNGIPLSAKPFERLGPIFRPADVAIANLEIPLCDSGSPTRRKSLEDRKAKRQFVLRADPGHAPGLREAGFDLVSLANNHVMDYGWEGLESTLSAIGSKGIRSAGAGRNWSEASQPAVFESPRGAKVALLSFLSFMGDGANHACTPAESESAGLAALKFGGAVGDQARATIRAHVAAARKRAPFVVVALHWGLEREPVPTPYQVALGRAFVDAGADVVVGHHPHVLQGAELYRGKPILYSTGNLVSRMPYESAAFVLEFSGNRFVRAWIHPLDLPGGKPRPYLGAARAAAAQRFESLCGRLARTYPHSAAQPLRTATD